MAHSSHYEALPPQRPSRTNRGTRDTRPDTIVAKQEQTSADSWAAANERFESEPHHDTKQAEDLELETLKKHKCRHNPCGAHFQTAEELKRHRADAHRTKGHENIPARTEMVCTWPRCGETYISYHYYRQHCEEKCRYRNNQDNHRLSKSKKSVLTVTQGNERPTEQRQPQVTTALPSSKQPKRKSSAAKSLRGGKKTQKTKKRSPSPLPAPINSYSLTEPPSSPEQDQFVTSRRPSAASIFATDDKDTPLTPQPAYLDNLDQSSSHSEDLVSSTPKAASHLQMPPRNSARQPYPPTNNSFGPPEPSIGSLHGQHRPSMPGPAHHSVYSFDCQPEAFVMNSGNFYSHYPPSPSLATFASVGTLPSFPGHGLEPLPDLGAPPHSSTLLPTDQIPPVAVTPYEMSLAGNPETIQQSTPIFQRIVDDRTGARMRITAPPSSGIRHYGNRFTQNAEVFEIHTPPAPLPENRNHWLQVQYAPMPHEDGMYNGMYPGHFTP